IGFDNALNLQLTQALPKNASTLVGGAGNAVLNQLQKVAPGVPDGSLVPTDRQGRALMYYTVRGTVSDPAFALDAQRMAAEGAGAAAGAARAALKARAAEEKAKVEAAARARLEAEQVRVREAAAAEKKKLEDKAAAEAKKQGQKLLEGLRK